MSTAAASVTLPTIRVNEVGEFVRNRSCERRFKLEFNGRAEARLLPFFERLFNPLDPVLQDIGRAREDEWEHLLIDAGIPSVDMVPTGPEGESTWADFLSAIRLLEPGQRRFAREISISTTVGAFHVQGRMDFVVVDWEGEQPLLRIIECKASRRDRTYHRIQVALYRMMVRQLLTQSPVLLGTHALAVENIGCSVARIDETTNQVQPIDSLCGLDLSMEEADLERLLSPSGDLIRIANSYLADLDYQLDSKCDNCVFNVHCLSESARQRRLELLSLAPSSIRILNDAGVSNLDDLADLDLASPPAQQVSHNFNFGQSLDYLQQKARARRSTLPGSDAHPDEYEVQQLPFTSFSQLPEHELPAGRLIRIFVTVEYDYAENRIGALAAHVTRSDGQLETTFEQANGRWRPDPTVRERPRAGVDQYGKPTYAGTGPLSGIDVVQFKTTPWTGTYDVDTAAERDLMQAFFQQIVAAIGQVAQGPDAPIHFYVWSRNEMTRLVEGCSRASAELLGHFRELLGCRESLEQLIYSCLQDEVSTRYALGWTGRGLSVISSLRWYGRRFHWVRTIGTETVSLDHVFQQDIFDFKTDLGMNQTRFHDSLSAPYWRAYWGTLPAPEDKPALVANAIRRYNLSARPGYLHTFLAARTHAMRWVEENVRNKSRDIQKPGIAIDSLPTFTLGVDNLSRAATDFLRLEQHVRVNDWVASTIISPATRVPLGRSLPIADLVSLGDNELRATIAASTLGLALEDLQATCTFAEGSFVRISPCDGDPRRGQTIRQLTSGIAKTCVIDSIDWNTGEIHLTVRPSASTRYMLPSGPGGDPGQVFDHAMLDESVSDFVAATVDTRITAAAASHVFHWFDPTHPQVPPQQQLPQTRMNLLSGILNNVTVASGNHLAADQIDAALEGLQARVQLLQGPPGTGKTTTAAMATLTRILARAELGDVILIAANTNTAIDNLLLRIRDVLPAFRQSAQSAGVTMPRINLARIHSFLAPGTLTGTGIQDIASNTNINSFRTNSVLVAGGTTNAVLKLARRMSTIRPYSATTEGFLVKCLIVDESSMILFPHFLALSTLVSTSGEIMLAGDNRQLSPIVSHDWEREDRPPVVLYQPYYSAYDAIRNLKTIGGLSDQAIVQSALSFTFRLPPVIRELIARLYQRDNIELDGLTPQVAASTTETVTGWQRIWQHATGLYLVVHNERQSRKSNELEADIIEAILNAGNPQPQASIGIVTPHRAQRTLLTSRIGLNAAVDVVDTVERLQGGERPTIIVSATASDAAAISTSAEFILDLNRSNVAFSRAQARLIVVCSEALLDHIPAEVEQYDSTLLWKSLRQICTLQLAAEVMNGYNVRLFAPDVA
jgi:hypothetical protein